jgi:DNA processing protein
MQNKNSNFPIQKVPKSEFKNHFFLKRLLELPDKIPENIYFKGSFPNEKTKFLTIVGSRNISTYGKDCLDFLFKGLEGYNICVISGLAVGVDSRAHELALKHNLPTIAIPGSGIDESVIYPSSNKKLLEKILENDGLIMNEFEPDFKATLWSFPMRNRIMAVLSDALLVIEAGEKSGSLITVRLATDYNKDILTIPGNIFSKNSFGPNNLIKDGATPITQASDILEVLKIKPREEIEKDKQKLEELNLTDLEKEILNVLDEAMSKDKISEKLAKYDLGEILTALTLLEWKGFVKEEVGVVRRIK